MWGNLHNVILPDAARTAWCMVTYDIIPTSVKLHKLRLMDTENCTQCGRQDTILHLLTECGVRQEIYEWIRIRVSRIQKMDPRLIPKEWLLRACFKLWPRQTRQAHFWFLANVSFFMWWIKVGPFRYWITLTECVRRGGRYIRTKRGSN